MKCAATALATLAVLGLLAVVFPYTGLYNVSAAEGHAGLVRWYLDTTANHSIQARADDVDVPPDLADSTRIVRGAGNFDAMCVVCHGAPGVERGEIGKGLTPEPPALSEAAAMWEPDEVYWILHEGIKLAGMPAFGPTHSEEALWDLVAFVERLPSMTPERYEMLTAVAPGHHGGTGGHTHGGGTGGEAGGEPTDGDSTQTGGHADHDHTH